MKHFNEFLEQNFFCEKYLKKTINTNVKKNRKNKKIKKSRKAEVKSDFKKVEYLQSGYEMLVSRKVPRNERLKLKSRSTTRRKLNSGKMKHKPKNDKL